MSTCLTAGCRPADSPFIEHLFLLQRKAAASCAPDATRSPLPPSTEHEHHGACDQFIETVDVWQLHQFHWPIMGVLAPGYVDHLELNRYLKRLLATGRWRTVHAAPRLEAGRPDSHRFDVYGEPTER